MTALITRNFNTTSITQIHQETPEDITVALAKALEQPQEYIIIMHGNLPLLESTVLMDALQQHITQEATLTTVQAHKPTCTVQTTDLSTQQEPEKSRTTNTQLLPTPTAARTATSMGFCIVRKSLIAKMLANTTPESLSQPWFIALIATAQENNQAIQSFRAPATTMLSVITMRDLNSATKLQCAKLIDYWMQRDVIFTDPETVHLDTSVSIGAQTTIGSNVHITGNTSIGVQCQIHNFSQLHDAKIGDKAKIFSHSALNQVMVGELTEVGPFAHLHNAVTVADHSAIGNFVEIQQSSVGAYTKARHLTYLGHARIGNRVNFGAGTITCNYDGRNKNTTTIEDNIFIGSNNTLVAPITIGKGSFTAAGSVITQSVPENTFAIGRAHQINKLDYAQKLREKVQEKNKQQ